MTHTSIIAHPPHSGVLVLREDYIAICNPAPDPNCAAAILSVFTFWMDWKIANSKQAVIHNALADKANAAKDTDTEQIPYQSNDLWVYKTMPDLQKDCYGLWGETKLTNNRQWLEVAGLLVSRDNPHSRWSRTKQYQINVQLIQQSIDLWFSTKDNPIPYIHALESVDTGNQGGKNTDSKAQEHGVGGVNTGNGLHREQTEETPEVTKKNTSKKPSATKSSKKELEKQIKQFQAIHWARRKKRIPNEAHGQGSFIATTHADFKDICQHESNITAGEYAAYLDYLLADKFYTDNPKHFPRTLTIAKNIVNMVLLARSTGSFGNSANNNKSNDNHNSEFGT